MFCLSSLLFLIDLVLDKPILTSGSVKFYKINLRCNNHQIDFLQSSNPPIKPNWSRIRSSSRARPRGAPRYWARGLHREKLALPSSFWSKRLIRRRLPLLHTTLLIWNAAQHWPRLQLLNRPRQPRTSSQTRPSPSEVCHRASWTLRWAPTALLSLQEQSSKWHRKSAATRTKEMKVFIISPNRSRPSSSKNLLIKRAWTAYSGTQADLKSLRARLSLSCCKIFSVPSVQLTLQKLPQ